MIETIDLVKQYKNGVRALDGLNLCVRQGEIFSLLGPNGAGKSSLIQILTTYHQPTAGRVSMLGKDLKKDAAAIRAQIACVAQNISIDAHLSLVENMWFQSRLYKLDPATAKKRIQTLIENFGLGEYLKHPVLSYSGGVKRRLDIAMNMVPYPQILFLDEPTVGMDIYSRKAMWEIMRKVRDDFGTTIFLTTHYLEEADQLSDTICIMKAGRALVQGTPASLRKFTQQPVLRIGFPDAQQAKQWAEGLAAACHLPEPNLRENSIYLAGEGLRETFQQVNRWLLQNDAPFEALEIVQPSLEDIFLKLTGKEE